MKYGVVVTPEAQVGTLERFSERCGFAREREYWEEDLHRARKTVYVLHVRHAGRRAAGEIENDS